MTRRRLATEPRRFWTAAEDAILRARYPHEPTAPLAQDLSRSLTATFARALGLGLTKTPAYLDSPAACRLRRGDQVGKAYRFKPGLVPANKGIRRPGYGPGRMKDTQFKPGHGGTKTMPIGATRLIDGYVYVKVAAVPKVPHTVNWLPLHILNWERANGRPLPEGHCLWFLDGDRTNVDVSNLTLVTRADNMRRNTVHNWPKPLAQTVQLIGALRRQIRRKTRAEEQDRRSA